MNSHSVDWTIAEGPQQTGSVFKVIQQRRSIGKMTSDRPLRSQIERLLEAGVCAPDHHNIQPWRFFVVTGNARHELGNIARQSLANQMEDITSEEAHILLQRAHAKLLRAPVIIIVASEHTQQPHVLDIENIEATAAAVQNMLLVAEELGLACTWRTKKLAYDPQVKSWLGMAQEDHIVALIDVGFPVHRPQKTRVKSFVDRTLWLGWEQES